MNKRKGILSLNEGNTQNEYVEAQTSEREREKNGNIDGE